VALPAAQQNVPSSIDLSCCTPPAPDIDEYVRDASGGFVVITTASWYFPAPQSTQATAEVPEYLPAAQFEHTPFAAKNAPALQSTHVFHTAPGSEVSTPARMDGYMTHVWTKIRM
jgi:hypothetical protein